jgi:uncharacterized protein YdeI (YjbR/CyaY-like superfamily)
MNSIPQDPKFFETPADLRDWFVANHETAPELWLGLHRVGSGRPSVTWPEAVDEALCVGWIDGIRKGIDEASYKNRLTPRRKGSTWSARNIARVLELEAEGRMQPAGRRAFEFRDEARSAIYAYERPAAELDAAEEAAFRANRAAWAWFERAAPSYRKTVTYWVVAAKKPETRARRLATLIADSAAGRMISPMTRAAKPQESA